MTPGSEMDMAVARAMGWTGPVAGVGTWVAPTGRDRLLPRFSTDDATALRWCVPWLRERQCEVTAAWYIDRTEVTVMATPRLLGDPEAGHTAATLAAALCQVVLAIGGQG